MPFLDTVSTRGVPFKRALNNDKSLWQDLPAVFMSCVDRVGTERSGTLVPGELVGDPGSQEVKSKDKIKLLKKQKLHMYNRELPDKAYFLSQILTFLL